MRLSYMESPSVEDPDDESPLYCPVARTYCDSEFCENGLCERQAGIEPDPEDD